MSLGPQHWLILRFQPGESTNYIFLFSAFLMLWHLEPTIWGEIAPLRFSQFLEIANDFPQEGTFHMQAKQSRPHI